MKYALLFALMAAAGCSNFGRDYRAALATTRVPGSVDGPWRGTWTSAGGHRGGLRCLLLAVPGAAAAAPATRPASPVQYAARFEATFAGIFTVHYTALLAGTAQGEATQLSGDHDLGAAAGGSYHYEATVTPARFDATYRAAGDRGEFHMVRP